MDDEKGEIGPQMSSHASETSTCNKDRTMIINFVVDTPANQTLITTTPGYMSCCCTSSVYIPFPVRTRNVTGSGDFSAG